MIYALHMSLPINYWICLHITLLILGLHLIISLFHVYFQFLTSSACSTCRSSWCHDSHLSLTELKLSPIEITFLRLFCSAWVQPFIQIINTSKDEGSLLPAILDIASKLNLKCLVPFMYCYSMLPISDITNLLYSIASARWVHATSRIAKVKDVRLIRCIVIVYVQL